MSLRHSHGNGQILGWKNNFVFHAKFLSRRSPDLECVSACSLSVSVKGDDKQESRFPKGKTGSLEVVVHPAEPKTKFPSQR